MFGLHTDLFGLTEYVTVLGNPAELVPSNYYYVRRSPGHRLHDSVVGKDISLLDYVAESINPALNNKMTRYSTNKQSGLSYNEKWILRNAKKNGKYLDVVGIVERFGESITAMKKKYDWRDIYYRKLNTNS